MTLDYMPIENSIKSLIKYEVNPMPQVVQMFGLVYRKSPALHAGYAKPKNIGWFIFKHIDVSCAYKYASFNCFRKLDTVASK